MKFKINNKWYIREYDERNWIIAQMVTPEYKTALAKQKLREKGCESEPKEKIFGYFLTLQEAKEEMAELVTKEAKNMKELEQAIKLIKSIK